MKKKLGFAMCGSFCTHKEALGVMEELSHEYEIVPILSGAAATYDTRFGTAEALALRIAEICSRAPVTTITEAERFGPAEPFDYMMICPCTGNTAAKLACGITDTPVTMAAKAHLRGDKPLVLALASNDAMSANFSNLGALMQKKNVFLVPMRQDAPLSKPHSLVADFSLCVGALSDAVSGKQLRPLFLT